VCQKFLFVMDQKADSKVISNLVHGALIMEMHVR
jgi:hypothetical protein